MIRMKGGYIEIEEGIRDSLDIKEGDFFQQKTLKDGSIVFKRIDAAELKRKIDDLSESLAVRVRKLANKNHSHDLLHYLQEIEKSLKSYEQSIDDSIITDNELDHYLPLEKDLAVLKAVYEGQDTLVKIADYLKLPASSVSEALTSLHTNDFVDFNRINDGKRGRPRHIYFLTWHAEQFCSIEFE